MKQRSCAIPLLQGVVLFAHNYASYSQLTALVSSIRAVREDCWISVDQEGGRVTRFRGDDYGQPLISAQEIGQVYVKCAAEGLHLAQETGYLNATQLKAVGIDAFLGPVLDIYRGGQVLDGRCFGQDAPSVIALARAYLIGMARAGLATVVKHFPGHGVVTEDTHLNKAQAETSFTALMEADLLPYYALIDHYQGVMCGHVVYTAVDDQPASFSKVWMQDILRQQLGFTGVVVSDCISMAAAQPSHYVENLLAVSQAGCDLIICSHVTEHGLDYLQLLSQFEYCPSAEHRARMKQLKATALVS